MIKESDLDGFTGTLQYHRSTFGKLNLTDGINFLRNETNCYWLIDIVESVQHLKEIQMYKDFLVWRIEVTENKSWNVTVKTDTDEPVLYEQSGTYTDFPFKEFEFYQEGNVLLLKSEH